ncbi:MAG TPA: hypothetical protein VLH75_04825 [Longimicrobiales bacterium]|nr:hypothetical protein [Longimicrobiales bacterium]
MSPVLGALHQHEVDHDGTTHHIEAAHGAHVPSFAEGDSRLASGGVKVPPAVLSGAAPELPVAPQVTGAASGPDAAPPAPRPPPGVLRSRAPPA